MGWRAHENPGVLVAVASRRLDSVIIKGERNLTKAGEHGCHISYCVS